MNVLALFAGAGGGILGGKLLGWRTVCAVERDAYAAQILAQRQNDGILRPFPIWSDVCSFRGKPWRGIVDVVSGGFPCQDISSAGKGAGIEGSRSGMWKHMARIINEVRPRFAFVENSPLLVSRGLVTVLSDLAEMGYDARWCIVSASDCGAPHKRDRIWLLATDAKRQPLRDSPCQNMESEKPERSKFRLHGRHWNVADSDGLRESQQKGSEREQRGRAINGSKEMADTASIKQQGSWESWFGSDPAQTREGETDDAFAKRVGHIWGIKSPMGRVANGVAHRVDRLKAIGNGQVPICAATAFRILSEGL